MASARVRSPEIQLREENDDIIKLEGSDEDSKPKADNDNEEPAAVEHIKPAVEFEENSEDERIEKAELKKNIIDTVKLMITNTGLVLLVAGYCAIGAFIFNAIEEPFERSECSRTRDIYEGALDVAVKKIDLYSENLQLSDIERSEKYSETMDQLRLDFQDSGWDLRTCETMSFNWSWMGAFFFCFTVLSTIGYGHIAPATPLGRFVVMFYAIVGLPIMFMALAAFGNVLASLFKWTYNVICCCGCCIRHRKARVRIRPPAIMWKVNAEGKPVGDGPSVLAEDTDSDIEEQSEVHIPLTVSLLVIASVLLIGAVIFQAFENWSYLDSAYFSFVSLSTIGFGDMVPEFLSDGSSGNQGKVIVTWLYIGLGMACVSMCLQMMQDEVAEKVKWLSQKFEAEKQQRLQAKMQREKEAKAQMIALAREAGQSESEDADDEEDIEERVPITESLAKVKNDLKTGIAQERVLYGAAHENNQVPASAKHSGMHSAMHSAEYSDVHSAMHSAEYSDVHSAMHSAEYSDVHSAMPSAKHSAMHSAMHSAKHSAMHSAMQSAKHSAMHSVMHSTEYSDNV